MKLLYEQRLEQQLLMTQVMKQSLEILQVSAIELKDMIEKESLENPLLEIEIENIGLEKESREKEKIDDYYRDEDNYEEIKKISNYKNKDFDLVSGIVSKEDGFIEIFLKDLKNELKNKKDIIIAEFIIDNLNARGFLEIEEDNVKDYFEKNLMSYDIEKFEYLRSFIKNLNPGGIASYDIKEYIIFQILDDEESREKELSIKIIENNFEEFGRKKLRDLKKIYKIDDETLKKIYKRVSETKPYPLRGLENVESRKEYIVPEIIVKCVEDKFEICLNDTIIPGFKFNQEYYRLLSEDKKAIEFLKEKAMRVRNLQKSIEQRNLTLYRVAKVLVEKQESFLKEGEKRMKPLTLSEVGEELELHESTISRVVNGKYMETPRGVFELKYFFSGRVKKENSSDLSMMAVQEMVKDIINKEDKIKPYNDKEISEILEKIEIKISKRTVANYRESLKILPTYLRKEI